MKLEEWSVAPGPPAAVACGGMTATGMVMVRLLLVLPIIYLGGRAAAAAAGWIERLGLGGWLAGLEWAWETKGRRSGKCPAPTRSKWRLDQLIYPALCCCCWWW